MKSGCALAGWLYFFCTIGKYRSVDLSDGNVGVGVMVGKGVTVGVTVTVATSVGDDVTVGVAVGVTVATRSCAPQILKSCAG